MRHRSFAALVFVALSGLLIASAKPDDTRNAPSPISIDHVPIAVHSLEDAANTYERLGFRLKPGRTHANGLVRRHGTADGRSPWRNRCRSGGPKRIEQVSRGWYHDPRTERGDG
jgi:hypothetical protein